MPRSKGANEEFFDAQVRHQVYLLAAAGSIRNEVIAILNGTEREIAHLIRSRLQGVNGWGPKAVNQTQRLKTEIRELRGEAWKEVRDVVQERLLTLGYSEPEFLEKTLRMILPIAIAFSMPNKTDLKGAVLRTPVQGRKVNDWLNDLTETDLARIMAAIRIGLSNEEPVEEVVRRVLGTNRLNGTDGVTAIARHNVDSLVRTFVIFAGSAAARLFFTENSDIFTEEQWVSVLDSRTTPICRSLDGRRFPIGTGPYPPIHFSCRSLRVAVLNGVAVAQRTATPVSENEILRGFARDKGIPPPKSRADLPPKLRGAYDAFRRREIKRLVGTVPGDLNYEQWLRGQSATFQDDVLGPTRGKLFRKGGLTLTRFVDRRGNQITLDMLADKERRAFVAAGLDPDAY